SQPWRCRPRRAARLVPRPGPGPASSRGSSSSCPPSAACGCSLGALLEDRDARQFLTLDHLEARITAGGDVREALLVEAEVAYGIVGVAAADHCVPLGRGEGLGDGLGAVGEGLELEAAHVAVPENGGG